MRIGFIGLGRMGLPMAANLLRAGHDVIGCDIAPARTAAFTALGGRLAATPALAAAAADITLSMVMNDAVLNVIACGPDGVLAGGVLEAQLLCVWHSCRNAAFFMFLTASGWFARWKAAAGGWMSIGSYTVHCQHAMRITRFYARLRARSHIH